MPELSKVKTSIAVLVVAGVGFAAAIAQAQEKQRKPNHLLGTQSPYLQQHVYNAVDWHPWGDEALEKAKREGKPIFLSVGYSTCHWCHVMSRESFEDDAIGEFLNANYVAIKVDRERRPDLDEQFMLATQALTGRGGWPNSVFMTSEAKPFYAATYLPPDAFMNILGQITNLWTNDRAALEEEGERVATGIIGFLNRTEAAKQLTPEALQHASAEIIKQVDYFSGGLGVAPKFPQEAALLFLLDQAWRGDKQALEVVIGALDGMLKGGIHDHVGGGFHRYAVDPNWRVPHFEKMLYNQAMIGRIFVRAYELTGEYRYKYTAIRMFDYVIREMQDEEGGFYSAQDAESVGKDGEKGEGLFYIWSKEEFDKLDVQELAGIKEFFEVTEDGNFEGRNTLFLTDLVSDRASKSDTTEATLYARLDAGLNRLRDIRDKTKTKPETDRKIIVSWNAMMIETLAHAAGVFDRPEYWKSAKASADYIINQMLEEDGLKRISFEKNIGVDAQLADYAGLGVALLALQDFAPAGDAKPDYDGLILGLAEDMRAKFADQTEFEGKAFWMTSKASGLGNFAPLDDNPIPSGNSLALQFLDGIAKREGDVAFRKRSKVMAATLSGFALASAQSRGTLVNTAYAVGNEPVGNLRYAANGNVKVRFDVNREERRLRLKIDMKDGWHINSNRPLEDYFVPTVMSIDGNAVDGSVYPAPLEKSLRFNEKLLSLYESELELEAEYVPSASDQPQKLALNIQACNDEICLEPETLNFRFWTDYKAQQD